MTDVSQLSFNSGVPVDESKLDPNPMVRAFGFGPPKKCTNCKHLFVKRYAGTYYKCDLRKNTNGPATDHRVRWNACSKFEGDD